jgi:nicotinamidase-related amidase
MSEKIVIDKSKTALVVIDLQKSITALPSKPCSAQVVISTAAKLVDAFRMNNMPVFLVHVDATKETLPNVISDQTFPRTLPPPQDWAEFVPELTPIPSDIVITKRQWGAFSWHRARSAAEETEVRYHSTLRKPHDPRLMPEG